MMTINLLVPTQMIILGESRAIRLKCNNRDCQECYPLKEPDTILGEG